MGFELLDWARELHGHEVYPVKLTHCQIVKLSSHSPQADFEVCLVFALGLPLVLFHVPHVSSGLVKHAEDTASSSIHNEQTRNTTAARRPAQFTSVVHAEIAHVGCVAYGM